MSDREPAPLDYATPTPGRSRRRLLIVAMVLAGALVLWIVATAVMWQVRARQAEREARLQQQIMQVLATAQQRSASTQPATSPTTQP